MVCRWNFVSICYPTGDLTTSGWLAVILFQVSLHAVLQQLRSEDTFLDYTWSNSVVNACI